jgi:hypothetical protein
VTASRAVRLLVLFGWSAAAATAAAAAGGGCGRRVVGRLPLDSGAGANQHDAATGGAADGPATTDGPPADAGDPSLPPNVPGACTGAGWCWTHPLPTADRLVQAFEVAPDDVWLIGASGTIVRLKGGAWSTMPSPTSALSAIWAAGADDVWVAGPGGPFHWDGTSWTLRTIPVAPEARGVLALWGCASDDVWAVGALASHWDGSGWTFSLPPGASGGFNTIWGSSCQDVWAGIANPFTASGGILRWTNGAWVVSEERRAERILGTGPDDIWSLAQGQLFRRSRLGTGALVDGDVVSLFPAGAGLVGVMDHDRHIQVRAGETVTDLPSLAPIEPTTDLWGRSPSDIWAFVARGGAAHWNGSAWTPRLPAWALDGNNGFKITGTSPTDLWAVVGSNVLHGDGTTWRKLPALVGTFIRDMWSPGPNRLWVLGTDSLIHRWNGADWESEDPPPRATPTLEMSAISGTGSDDVWVLRGANTVMHWDGTSWTASQPVTYNLTDVWAAAPDDAWFVGDGILHWQSGAWAMPPRIPASLAGLPLLAVTGNGPTDVWVMAGASVYKVSDDHRDLNHAVSTRARFVALTPAGGSDVWTLVQDAGASYVGYIPSAPPNISELVIPAPAGLNDIWAASDGTLWAAGPYGALIRRRPP